MNDNRFQRRVKKSNANKRATRITKKINERAQRLQDRMKKHHSAVSNDTNRPKKKRNKSGFSDVMATNLENKKEGGGGERTHNLAGAETENDAMKDTN